MRKIALLTLAFALVAGIALAGGGKLEWQKDYAKGLAAAKEAGKPVMIYFTADW